MPIGRLQNMFGFLPNKGRSLTVMVSVLMLISLFVLSGKAQSRTASVVGIVKDTNDAAIPGAKVTTTNVRTGESVVTVSGPDGEYTILNLLYGDYRVKAEKEGFKVVEASGIVLEVGQSAKLDLTLTPGAVNETVTVTQSEVLETQTSNVSHVIDSKKVLDMPLLSRGFLELAVLAPGVVAPQTTTGPGASLGSAVTINGNGADFNNFTVDGVDNNAPLVNSQAINPTIDAIQEIRIESNSSAAEYGRAAAQIMVATRSGSNQFHGGLYEFLRNDALDARNFFDRSNTRPPLRQNTFGGTIGGPIVSNRTFFFFSYDGLRIRSSGTSFGIVPTQAFRNGDFSSLTKQLKDPSGNPLIGNIIPAASINPKATALLNFLPLPNLVDPVFNYIDVTKSTDGANQFLTRIDHNFGQKDQAFFRYSQRKESVFSPGLFSDQIDIGGDNRLTDSRNIGISYTHTISPTKMNLLRLGYNYFNLRRIPQGFEQDFGNAVLPPPQEDPRFGFTSFGISGYNGIGFGDRWIKQPDHVYQVSDTFSWVLGGGKHTFKAGLDIRRWMNNLTESFTHTLNFDGRFTGNSIADMLYGNAASGSVFNGNFQQYLRRWDQAYFAQTDWRVTPHLTLNLGLRYEYIGPITDKRDNLSNFDFQTRQVIAVGAGYPTGRNRTARDLNNFAPRIGFAWNPARSPRTTFRGAYGIYYVPAEGQSDLINGPKNGIIYSFVGNVSNPEALSFDNPAPIGSFVAGGFPSVSAVDPNLKIPYVQQWNLTISQEVKGNILLEASYIGNKGTKLWTIRDANAATPGPGPIQARRPYPQFGTIEVNEGSNSSSYNALQTKVEKRLGASFTLLGSYTWSKAIDYNDFLGSRIYNPFDINQDRGLADSDVRHRFVASWTYELPFGRGKAFLTNAHPVVDRFLGGWSVGAITIAQSGMPFTVTAQGDPANWGRGTRPNVVGNAKLDAPTIREWFNTAAFVAPAQFTIGDAGRNILIGPGRYTWDIVAHKTFYIHEEHRLQLRAEFFNAFNRANFGYPNAQLGNANFGVIASAFAARIVQLALKYNF